MLVDEGWFLPFWLDLDGQTIAFIYGAIFDGTYFALKTSFIKEHSKLSPGIRLFHEAVGHAFQAGLRRFDFVGQTSRWKEEWATGSLEHVDLRLYPAGPAGNLTYLHETRVKPALRRLRNRGGGDS